jgi:uncharacterized metal-binding protein
MDEKQKPRIACASCDVERAGRICQTEDGRGAKGCPTITRTDILAQANDVYSDPQVREFARQASIQEAECYAHREQTPYVMQPSKTRLVELMEFSQRMNYQKLGLAFCMGLKKEAGVVTDILEANGFEVISILCKAGRTLKEFIGLTDEHKIHRGTQEAMCNPIYQAKVLNAEQTEFNILLGLCVGHDSLFFKYADSPTSVLAVKDRVTGHNPLAAIYLADTYYQKIKKTTG